MFFRFPVEQQPERQPDEPECAGENESPLPAEPYGDEGNEERSCDGADI
jgi:hypothetical protein